MCSARPVVDAVEFAADIPYDDLLPELVRVFSTTTICCASTIGSGCSIRAGRRPWRERSGCCVEVARLMQATTTCMRGEAALRNQNTNTTAHDGRQQHGGGAMQLQQADIAGFADYKIIRRNGSVVGFEPRKIAVAMTKAFLAVAAARRRHPARCANRSRG
jgi:hypothetical protein